MISAKYQIDCLIKSNKIVVFYDHQKANNFKTDSNKTKNSNNNINQVGDLSKDKMDTIKLFDIYGVMKEFITVIYLNELKNSKLCETYLKTFLSSNQEELKYPLVFIYGILFGSDDEINLAHNEGFLFDLFKDTGLYSISLDDETYVDDDDDAINNDGGDVGAGYENDTESYCNENYNDLYEEKSSYYVSNNNYNENENDDDNFAIDKVARFNISSIKLNKTYSIDSIKNQKSKTVLTYRSFLDSNSDNSSLNSISKSTYCLNYIESIAKRLEKTSDKSLFTFNELTKSNFSNKMTNSDLKDDKKPTPRSDVLATINKWLKKSKQVIEMRNEKIVKKE